MTPLTALSAPMNKMKGSVGSSRKRSKARSRSDRLGFCRDAPDHIVDDIPCRFRVAIVEKIPPDYLPDVRADAVNSANFVAKKAGAGYVRLAQRANLWSAIVAARTGDAFRQCWTAAILPIPHQGAVGAAVAIITCCN